MTQYNVFITQINTGFEINRYPIFPCISGYFSSTDQLPQNILLNLLLIDSSTLYIASRQIMNMNEQQHEHYELENF